MCYDSSHPPHLEYLSSSSSHPPHYLEYLPSSSSHPPPLPPNTYQALPATPPTSNTYQALPATPPTSNTYQALPATPPTTSNTYQALPATFRPSAVYTQISFRGPPFNLQERGRVSGDGPKYFFTIIQQIYLFFQLLGHQITYFTFSLYLFQLQLEGKYLLQPLVATNYLFYHLLALNYLFQKLSLPPPQIKWLPPYFSPPRRYYQVIPRMCNV